MEPFDTARLIYLIMVLVILVPGALYRYRRSSGRWLWDLLFWFAALALISLTYIALFEPDFIAPPGKRWDV